MRILVINPGSTSTKLALYERGQLVIAENLSHSPAELEACGAVMNQYNLRKKLLQIFVNKNIELYSLTAIVGRGGLTKPLIVVHIE